MTRRELLASGAALTLTKLSAAPEPFPTKARLGGSPTTFVNRAKQAKEQGTTFDIISFCHQLGLSGAEVAGFPATPDAVTSVRKKLEAFGMMAVYNVPLPKSEADVPQFANAVNGCKEAGAYAIHAAMTARRYEQFDSLQAFRANFAQCQKSVELAEPVLQKAKLRLAIENHKGWRAAEQAAWMQRVSSEWVGVCVDMGNNLSLCEMPDETFSELTPYAIFSHIKDMGLEDYADGFLLSEVPFGQGVINLSERISQLRQKDANMLFCLEMITRDPLKIPVFTSSYWQTFQGGEAEIPGRDLAMVLNLVRTNHPKIPLPRTAGLTPEQVIKAEDDNNLACIRYAKEYLNMA